MFEQLIARVHRAQAEVDFELARTNDPYRLEHLLRSHRNTLDTLLSEASLMVKELEGMDDAI